MAETFAVVGFISAIAQFVDFGSKVISRLEEFRQSVNDVPKTFQKISRQLPLLIVTLRRTQIQAHSGHLIEETATALMPMVEGCLACVKELEDILAKTLPSEKDSTWSRRTKALASLAYDKTVQRITSQLDSNVGTLAYHQATSTSELIELTQEKNLATDHEGKDYQCLCDLRLTDPRDDKTRIEQSKDDLLKESYVWILDDPAFRDWLDNDDTKLLWIKGDPGKGKTMLMMGLIKEQLESRHKLGMLSYFFCQATDPSLNNAVSVLRGLIYLLVDQQKDLIQHLRRKYDTSGRPLFEDSNAFFALSAILSDILDDPSLARVYMMIDGLDECTFELSHLLNLIVRYSSKSSKVKWIVSSRNRLDIEERLRPGSFRAKINLELNSSHISRAVNAFIDFKVSELTELKSYANDFREKVRSYLYEKADGTFLWVALVCKALRKLQVRKTLSALEKFPPGLQLFYERMMEQVFCLEDSDDARSCIQILSSVTLAHRPIRLKELVAIAGLQEEHNDIQSLTELVNLCGSFLIVREETVYFVHQSAKDYIATSKDARLFPLGQAEKHREITFRSLEALSNTLKRDISDLRLPGALLNELDSDNQDPLAHIRYACCYWVSHLRDASNSKREQTSLSDNGEVHVFLQKHFLHWLEALSLMKNTSHGALMLRTLECMLMPISSTAPQLLSIVQNAKRFILKNRLIIEKTPLQVYTSALIFTPNKNSIRNLFLNQRPMWIKSCLGVGENSALSLKTLDGHSSHVTTAAFSPNGRRIASASWDTAVRLWDAETGALQQTLEGHSLGVTAIAFLSNGQGLVSSSDDKTVRFWDTKTGALQQTLNGHSSSVKAVTVSPDGQQLALGLEDKTLRIWDAKTGALQHTLEGHSLGVKAVTFSPNGWKLASASCDNTLRVWDAKTGALQHTLRGHSSSVLAVSFSPNGQRLASASWDTTVRIWNAETGALQQTLKGHFDCARAIAFSPNGRQLASASWDRTIRLWDAETGMLQQTLTGHSDYVMSVTFSPDGRRLASASWDKTVRLWDAETGVLQQTLKGYSLKIEAIALSPNKQQLALALEDKTLQLWDAKTGDLQQTLKGHSDSILAVAFSFDGQRLISASKDQSIKLWNTRAWVLQQTLKGHSDSVLAVTFSSDGRRLASASEDKSVRLWDAEAGTLRNKLESHSGSVLAVAFSSDGRQLASASEDKSIRLWDAETGTLQYTLEGHSDSVLAVAFSAGGQLVSTSEDKTIRLWDVETGTLQYTLKGHSKAIKTVAFSPSGQHIVTNLGSVALGALNSDSIQTTTWPLYSLNSDNSWILWKGHRVLWIPSEYRLTYEMFQDDVLVTGNSSGRVTIITFNLDVNLLKW